MAKTMMSLKIDTDIKKKAQKIAKDMGIPLGTIINAYLRQFVKDKKIELSSEPKYYMSEELEKMILDAQSERKSKDNYRSFSSAKQAIDYLESYED